MSFVSRTREFIYVNHRQGHGHGSSPDRFIFQVPRQFIDTAVAEGMPGNGITALNRQRLTKDDVIVRSICSTAANLSKSITTTDH